MVIRKPLASASEVAEYLQVPLQTVYQWRSKGVGPRGSLVGRHIRYRWEDVEKWLDRQASEAA
jgi:excisionase family DNA binding protein